MRIATEIVEPGSFFPFFNFLLAIILSITLVNNQLTAAKPRLRYAKQKINIFSMFERIRYLLLSNTRDALESLIMGEAKLV